MISIYKYYTIRSESHVTVSTYALTVMPLCSTFTLLSHIKMSQENIIFPINYWITVNDFLSEKWWYIGIYVGSWFNYCSPVPDSWNPKMVEIFDVKMMTAK